MPVQTDIQLTARATIVQNETISRANTALRVGSLLIDMIANKVNINTLDTDVTLAADSDEKLATQKAVKAFVLAQLELVTPIVPGTIDLWGGLPGAVPEGWGLCNGAPVSRATYADLFAVIGTLHGAGDGTTTFNLPNIGKRVVAGYDAGDTDYDTVGETGGNSTATLTDQQIAHGHEYDKYEEGAGGIPGDAGPDDFGYIPTDTSDVGDTGIARAPVDLRNKYYVLPYKIKF